jgi:hypothetical protein
VRAVSRTGTITTVAGNGTTCSSPPACGDGGSAAAAALTAPQGVAVDPAGNLYVSDTEDHELRLVTPASAKPSSLKTATGRVSLLAFASTVTRTRVTVRYALTGVTSLTLSVGTPTGRRVVAHANGQAGVGALVWNRRLGSRTTPPGRYQLIVTATVGKTTMDSMVTVRL